MTKEEIDVLKKKSFDGDHNAQYQIGKYYYDSNFSNNNFANAETFLRMASEKHHREAIELLINLYYKYMVYFIKEKKAINRINTCFTLGTKWCKIGISTGFDFSKQQNMFVEEYAKASNESANINLNYKLNKKFKKITIVAGVLILIILGLSIASIFLIKNNLKYCLFIIPALLILAWVFVLTYVLKINKKNNVTKHLVKDEDMENFVDKKNIANLTGIEKIKQIYPYTNAERLPIDFKKRGILGECYIYYVVNGNKKWFFNLVNNKLKNYNTIAKKIEWNNNGVETNDPYDFVITCGDSQKVYMDVKTSITSSNKIMMSTLEDNFIKKNKYLICKINNFWPRNVDDFLGLVKGINVSIYDMNNENDKKMLEIDVHKPTSYVEK